MIYSTDRILTTHAGSLPRPPDLREMVTARSRGEAVDEGARVAAGVEELTQGGPVAHLLEQAAGDGAGEGGAAPPDHPGQPGPASESLSPGAQ